MRLGLFLAFAPAFALAAGPAVLPGPDLRLLSDGPKVYAPGDDTTTRCVFRAGQAPVCSDGREITTTRASAVPCETSPGVWTYAPPDTACVSVRGLESWGENTTLIAWGNKLDAPPWSASAGGSVQPIADGWRVSNESLNNAGWRQELDVADGTYTSACILRNAPANTRLYVGSGAFCPIGPLGSEWSTLSCTRGPDLPLIYLGIHPCGTSGAGVSCTADVAACWLTQASTPGRPCWAEDGSAPYTCEADSHTISTEGWPTEEGRVEVAICPSSLSGSRYILGRATGSGTSIFLSGASLVATIPGASGFQSGSLPWACGDRAGIERTSAGIVNLLRNGEVVASQALGPLTWDSTEFIGRSVGGVHFDGSISRLTWSTK